MKIYMNTFCFLQENDFAQNESMSYLGKKKFVHKLEIPKSKEIQELNTNSRSVLWELKKQHIDLANKNENINPDFTVIIDFFIIASKSII